jgi:hypothetical protein
MIQTGLLLGIQNREKTLISTVPVLPTKIHGDMALFDANDALRVLNFCGIKKLSILGIEGFRLHGDNIIPDMDCIADFSMMIELEGDNFQRKSLEWSRFFINQIADKNVFLEFVLAES